MGPDSHGCSLISVAFEAGRDVVGGVYEGENEGNRAKRTL